MADGDNWYPTARYLPEDGKTVWAMDSGGTVSAMKLKNNLWFFNDESMYVYYTPVFWKDI